LLSNAVKFQSSFRQENILPIVLSYMHVPYVWGGRTHAGIDCSGFSAMLYKYFNIPLKHEATWQSQQGQVLDFLQNAKCGDLAFFDDEDGNITHVGILLNESEIIHATESAGGVTIDDIDNAGIVSRLTGKRTHRLRVVKRIVE
jgi:cell wall-associated NlpC family hydrolase